MTEIKLCGLSDISAVECANEILPDYIGFVFFPKSPRYIQPEQAALLKRSLDPRIRAAGVFVNERVSVVADLLERGIIDIAQLHGSEDEGYIRDLRSLTRHRIIRAFRVSTPEDTAKAEESTADYILLDSGAGSGSAFDWSILKHIKRDYFLAGGLDPINVPEAIRTLHPFGVDVSSGIETDGKKDHDKMRAFARAVRQEG